MVNPCVDTSLINHNNKWDYSSKGLSRLKLIFVKVIKTCSKEQGSLKENYHLQNAPTYAFIFLQTENTSPELDTPRAVKNNLVTIFNFTHNYKALNDRLLKCS